MPGNEVEDRVHNFFAPDDLSSGHHQSQAADGSWQGLGNNLWPGSQNLNGLPTSNSKGYNLQQTGTDRGQTSHSFQVANGLNYGRPTLGPGLAKTYSQNQPLNSNGYMNGHQLLQTRQSDANFLGVDTESERYTMTPRGLPAFESGGNGLEDSVGSARSESSESRIGFDFLGGQQQMSGQQIGMLQSQPQQLLHQQVMQRKIQELQRRQLEARHNNSLNQNPSIINGAPVSPFTTSSINTWPSETSSGNKSWLHRASEVAQGSPNEPRFSQEQGQTLSLMGLNPQQVDQSLYGVPVSNTRGSPSHNSHLSVDKHQMQQMAMFNNSSPGNQSRGPTNEVNLQDGFLGSRHGFHEEIFLGQPSGQSLTKGMNSENPQLVNPLQRDSSLPELAGPLETIEGNSVFSDPATQNAVALDPTEEKILFGEGNIWDSFGTAASTAAGGGSWSALMQSAVAETSSNDLGLQEELSGPSIQNTEPMAGPLSDDVNINKNFQGMSKFQQSVVKYPHEHGDRLQMDSTNRSFLQYSEEGSKWLSRGPLPKPMAEGTQINQKSTRPSDAHVNVKSTPGSRDPQQNVPFHISGKLYDKPNGRDDVETPSSSENDVSNFHGNESRLQQSGNSDKKRMFHREISQGVPMWKSVPGPQSTGGLINMQETENNERKENSCERDHSKIFQHTNDKVSVDGGDTKNLLGRKQKVTGQGGQKVSGPRKFQYHPMGNLEEDGESSFGRKSITSNQSQGYLGQSKSFGQFPKTSSEMEKGNMFGVVQQNQKGAVDSPFRGTLAGFAPNTSQPSQNIPRFPQNTKQSKENSKSDGSIGPFKQSPSDSSHGFGLHLGFPSQLSPVKNHALSSHSSAQLAGSLSSAHISPEMRENDTTSQETSEGGSKRNEISGTGPSRHEAPQHRMLGNSNSATSGFPFPRSQFQGQQVGGAVDWNNPHSLQTRINKKERPISSGDTSQHTDAIFSHENVPKQEVSVRTMPNVSESTSRKNILSERPHNKFPPGTFHPGQVNNGEHSTPSSRQVGVYGEGRQAKGSLLQRVPSADLAPMPSASQGKDSVVKNQTDVPTNSASSERDFVAFGRSLKPSDLPHQNYSLLNQMRAMKSTDIDPSNRDLKIVKGVEASVGTQMRQSSEQSATVGDEKILSFSGSAASVDNTNSSSLLANVPTQDVLVPSRMDSGNNPCSSSMSFLRAGHSQISPQMAPSWFQQYGTFKNGQMLPVNDAHKHSTSKTTEQVLLGKSLNSSCANNMTKQAIATADSIKSSSIWPKSADSAPIPAMFESLPSAHLMGGDVTNKGLIVARPKKRKSATPLPSWHKEVTQGSQSLLSTSMAEVEWARAANRLIDKVQDGAETFQHGPPRRRSKRRLIVTTQLMQQLFRPPMAGILSAGAYPNCDAVAYMGGRLALGDACSLMLCSKNDSCSPLDKINSSIGKHETTDSERISDKRLSEVTEHFIGRAKKLENDFMRLDKRPSVVDLRVESQDLDKVSVINRFAKFHGRGQADLVPPGPQRYVNAQPMPKVLPERVQCLSL